MHLAQPSRFFNRSSQNADSLPFPYPYGLWLASQSVSATRCIFVYAPVGGTVLMPPPMRRRFAPVEAVAGKRITMFVMDLR